MIYATGIDIVEHARIANTYARFGTHFVQRILHTSEYKTHYSIPYLASRFAVKEAALKALQIGFTSGVRWQDIATVKGNNNEPLLHFYGKAQIRVEQLGIQRVCVSISHEKKYSIALVLCEK